jgi:hypothetical protein
MLSRIIHKVLLLQLLIINYYKNFKLDREKLITLGYKINGDQRENIRIIEKMLIINSTFTYYSNNLFISDFIKNTKETLDQLLNADVKYSDMNFLTLIERIKKEMPKDIEIYEDALIESLQNQEKIEKNLGFLDEYREFKDYILSKSVKQENILTSNYYLIKILQQNNIVFPELLNVIIMLEKMIYLYR